MGNALGIELEGRVVTVSDSYIENEPCLVQGGFGSHPETMGNALMVKGLITGFQWRSEGYRVLEDLYPYELHAGKNYIPVEMLEAQLDKELKEAIEELDNVLWGLGSYLYHSDYKIGQVPKDMIEKHKEVHRKWTITAFWHSMMLQRKMSEGVTK